LHAAVIRSVRLPIGRTYEGFDDSAAMNDPVAGIDDLMPPNGAFSEIVLGSGAVLNSGRPSRRAAACDMDRAATPSRRPGL
jgi:hypothetical protein